MIFTIVILLLITAILYFTYAGVIRARNTLDEALSGIDVQLKQRADLIPEILTLAQKFMKHEKEIFTEITKLRTEAMKAPVGTAKRFELEGKLQHQMRQLSITMENYPDVKSGTPIEEAMSTYRDVEGNIAAARRFYNAALKDLKNKIQIFPGSLFASYAGDISELTYFQATEEDKKKVQVSDYLK